MTKLTYLVGAKRLQEKNRDTEYLLSQEQLEMFERLVAFVRVDEREACAEAVRFADNGTEAAEIIRARGNT